MDSKMILSTFNTLLKSHPCKSTRLWQSYFSPYLVRQSTATRVSVRPRLPLSHQNSLLPTCSFRSLFVWSPKIRIINQQPHISFIYFHYLMVVSPGIVSPQRCPGNRRIIKFMVKHSLYFRFQIIRITAFESHAGHWSY